MQNKKKSISSPLWPGEDRGELINMYICLMDRYQENGATLLSIVLSNRVRGDLHKLKNVKFHKNMKTKFFEGDRTLEQATWKGCGLQLWSCSKPTCTQLHAACSGLTCFSRGAGLRASSGPFQPQPFCDSVVDTTGHYVKQ